MAAPLTASPAAPRTLSETTAGGGAGTYPSSVTYPGSDVYPGRGSDLSASADTAGDGFIPESIPFTLTGGYGPLQAVPA